MKGSTVPLLPLEMKSLKKNSKRKSHINQKSDPLNIFLSDVHTHTILPPPHLPPNTHTYTHTPTHACTHAHTRQHTHTSTNTHTHTHRVNPPVVCVGNRIMSWAVVSPWNTQPNTHILLCSSSSLRFLSSSSFLFLSLSISSCRTRTDSHSM